MYLGRGFGNVRRRPAADSAHGAGALGPLPFHSPRDTRSVPVGGPVHSSPPWDDSDPGSLCHLYGTLTHSDGYSSSEVRQHADRMTQR